MSTGAEGASLLGSPLLRFARWLAAPTSPSKIKRLSHPLRRRVTWVVLMRNGCLACHGAGASLSGGGVDLRAEHLEASVKECARTVRAVARRCS